MDKITTGRKTFRCRIARQLDCGVIEVLSYLGSLDGIPAGWSIVMRRVALKSVA